MHHNGGGNWAYHGLTLFARLNENVRFNTFLVYWEGAFRWNFVVRREAHYHTCDSTTGYAYHHSKVTTEPSIITSGATDSYTGGHTRNLYIPFVLKIICNGFYKGGKGGVGNFDFLFNVRLVNLVGVNNVVIDV